jgi:hypothetical protein
MAWSERHLRPASEETMTEMSFKIIPRTASSDMESVASNLQCVTAVTSSWRASWILG